MSGKKIFNRLDRGTALPLYQQIKEEITRHANSGHWPAGRKLPSENELVEMLGVSRMTINRALRELTLDGALIRVHGVGTFVAERPPHASLIQLRDIAEEIRENGKNHRLEVLLLEKKSVSDAILERMELSEPSMIFHLKAVHYQDEVPIQYEDRFVNPLLAPAFLEVDFSRTTATGYLVNLVKPDEMEHVVEAVLPELPIAASLNINRTEPCLKLSRRTWKGTQVVTSVSLFYPGSRYALGARYATEDYQIR